MEFVAGATFCKMISFVLHRVVFYWRNFNEIQCRAKYAIFSITGCAFLVIVFVAVFVFLHFYLDDFTNSDDASELVLSHFLAQNNQRINQDWFYSTELRVFDHQLVFTALFQFFENWHWMRLWGSAICCGILIASFYFLLRFSMPKIF